MKELRADLEIFALQAKAKFKPTLITAEQHGNLHHWDVHIDMLGKRIDMARHLRWIPRKPLDKSVLK